MNEIIRNANSYVPYWELMNKPIITTKNDPAYPTPIPKPPSKVLLGLTLGKNGVFPINLPIINEPESIAQVENKSIMIHCFPEGRFQIKNANAISDETTKTGEKMPKKMLNKEGFFWSPEDNHIIEIT